MFCTAIVGNCLHCPLQSSPLLICAAPQNDAIVSALSTSILGASVFPGCWSWQLLEDPLDYSGKYLGDLLSIRNIHGGWYCCCVLQLIFIAELAAGVADDQDKLICLTYNGLSAIQRVLQMHGSESPCPLTLASVT